VSKRNTGTGTVCCADFVFHVCHEPYSAGTGAGGLHVELCVPNKNHRAYSVVRGKCKFMGVLISKKKSF
jgi:hypothetical protein